MARLAGVGVGGGNPVRIMGILNASPESFYRRSVRTGPAAVRDAVARMESDGADWVDVGGMSTAPYLSTAVPEATEAARVVRAIRAVTSGSNLPVSVDTCRAPVARAALEEGAEILNDVSGLQYDPRMADVVSRFRPSLVLCAFSRTPVAGDQVAAAARLLRRSAREAAAAGARPGCIVVDPSVGFFRKRGRGGPFTRIPSDQAARDAAVIRGLRRIKGRLPALVSVSNKSFLGEATGRGDPADRAAATAAAEALAVLCGADALRTHDVAAAADAAAVAKSVGGRKGL